MSKNIAVCFGNDKINKSLVKVAKKNNDNFDYFIYTSTNTLVRDLSSKGILVDRIILRTTAFSVSPEQELENLKSYLRQESPNTDVVLIYQTTSDKEVRLANIFNKVLNGPNYVRLGYVENNATTPLVNKWLNERIAELKADNETSGEKEAKKSKKSGLFGRKKVANQVVDPDDAPYEEPEDEYYNEPQSDPYADIDNDFDSNAGYDPDLDYEEEYSNEPANDYEDDFNNNYADDPIDDYADDPYIPDQPQNNNGSVYSGCIQPSQKQFVVFISDDTISLPSVVTDMAQEEANRGKTVAIIDLDEINCRTTLFFDTYEFYEDMCNMGIDRRRDFIDKDTNVHLISNGFGAEVSEQAFNDLVNDDTCMRGFDTIIIACPFYKAGILRPTFLRRCDVRILVKGTLSEMFSAYGAITNRKNIAGIVEDSLYENGTLYIFKDILDIDPELFNEDLDILRSDVIWTRNLWLDPQKTVIL